MKPGPLVSILINNYNYAHFLADAIRSSLNQTYQRREIIVVDDGSTDHSRDIISSFGPQVIPVFKNNGGQASAFNAGFAASRGEIICLLDADDIFLSTKVEKTVETYELFPEIGWCFHNQEHYSPTGAIDPAEDVEFRPYDMSRSREYDLRRSMKFYRQKISPPATSGCTFRRNILAKILPMPEARDVLVSDTYIKYVAFSLAPGYYLTDTLSKQRIHENNRYTFSKSLPAMKSRITIMTALAVRERFPDLKRFANNYYAKGLSARIKDHELEFYIDEYRKKLSWPERVEIAILTTLHFGRQYVLAKKSTLLSRPYHSTTGAGLQAERKIVSPIFIAGTQRSGTTLLRLMLNAHSQIAIPEEATFLMPLLNKKYLHKQITGASFKRLVNYLALNSHCKLWGPPADIFVNKLSNRDKITLRELIDGFFGEYCKQECKVHWGDKTPSFFRKYSLLLTLYPNAKFIHIVRDGRDVFDSWRRIDPTKDDIGVTALDWKYKLFKIEKLFWKMPAGNHLTVRYEDLLDRPEKTLSDACSFLGVPYEPGMLEFYKTSRKYIGTHHSQFIFSPIDARNKYKWRYSLTGREVRIFNFIAGRQLRKYGYHVAGTGIKLMDLGQLAQSFSLGIIKRVSQIANTKKAFQKALRNGKGLDSVTVGEMPDGFNK